MWATVSSRHLLAPKKLFGESQTLIFALVQAGVRQTLAAALDVGPSRAMQGLMAKNTELVQKKVRRLPSCFC